jgi:tetratricopeptide (TPR) repeat protein
MKQEPVASQVVWLEDLAAEPASAAASSSRSSKTAAGVSAAAAGSSPAAPAADEAPGPEPSDAAGWQQLGNSRFKAKQYDAAIRCYTAALELLQRQGDGAVLSALTGLAEAHLQLGQPAAALQQACAAYAIADAASSRAPQALVALALARLGSEGHGGARCSAQEVGASVQLALQSEGPVELVSTALQEEWLGLLKAAQQRQKQPAADVAKGRLGALRALADSLAQAGDGGGASGGESEAGEHEAAGCFKAAAAATGSGRELLGSGQCQDAAAQFSTALSELQKLPLVALLNNRALCRLQQAQGAAATLKAALGDAAAALVLEPGSEKALYRCG